MARVVGGLPDRELVEVLLGRAAQLALEGAGDERVLPVGAFVHGVDAQARQGHACALLLAWRQQRREARGREATVGADLDCRPAAADADRAQRALQTLQARGAQALAVDADVEGQAHGLAVGGRGR